MDNIDAYIKTAGEWIENAIKLVKTAWEQPYAPEMLGGALAAFVLLVLYRKIKNFRKPIRLFDNRRGGRRSFAQGSRRACAKRLL